MPVLTKNQQPGPTVFRDKARDILVEWERSGDEMGGDYQHIPNELLENPQFLKAVKQGLVTIEDASDEIDAALAKSGTKFAVREAAAREQVAASLSEEENKDLVAEPCIGPGSKSGSCDVAVPVKVQERGSVPPLCSTHASLRSQFVLTHTDDLNADGEPVTKWVRVAIDRDPLPSQQ